LTIEKVMVSKGLDREEVEEAQTGDIVAITGIEAIKIGQTLTEKSDPTSLPEITITEPTLHMTFGKFKLSGRGELHLSVLLETMRREGYEMEVGKPEVITKTLDGQTVEPVEEVDIIVPSEYVGVINQELGKRFATIIKMEPLNEVDVEFIYHMPTRAIIGLRSLLLTLTKGTVIFSSQLKGYEPIGKPIPKLRRGVLIADQAGQALGYGLNVAQGRGITFIDPGTQVYEGMIVGLNAKDEDIRINVCKGKKLTNMRSKSSDGILQLIPALQMSLEQSLDFLESDELLEITPKSLRLRKKYLTELDFKKRVRQERFDARVANS
jgi:GTP-binding protein